MMTLRGVRTHNLKSIDVDLPLNQLIAVTGPSGAGKSSLAFDSIYAEGQRRYVETFSAYTRQFLEKLDKPDADTIAGIPPAIGVVRNRARPSGRGTLSTLVEVHDGLGLLFARAGSVFCRNCGEPVVPATPATVARSVEALPAETRYEVAFPVEVVADTEKSRLAQSLIATGFTRARVAGQLVRLDDDPFGWPSAATIDVIVDRLVRGKDAPDRLADSIESAFGKGFGRCRILTDQSAFTYSRGWRCGRCGTEHIEPQPNLFRFTSSFGACPTCEGFGQTLELDIDRIVPDRSRSIAAGAIAPWATPAYQVHLKELIVVAPKLGIPVDRPFRDLTPDQVAVVMHGKPGSSFTGLAGFFRSLERRAYKLAVRAFLSRWRRHCVCPVCQGTRLRPEARAVRIDSLGIAELSAFTIRDARAFLAAQGGLRAQPTAAHILGQLDSRLQLLSDIGLDYLTLDRSAASLSSGEYQRATLAKTLGSGLVNTLYVLDEPAVGLHPHEHQTLVRILQRLRDRGNTVIVVEHQDALIRASDFIVDLGPGAGEAGGRVVHAGTFGSLLTAADSATGDFLAGRKRVAIPKRRRKPATPPIELLGASGNNLKAIDVTFPTGVLCVVTGVSGAGKSTLIEETLYPAARHALLGELAPAAPFVELRGISLFSTALFLDQSPSSRSGRSNPVTHVKAFDEIRKTFASTHEAKVRNYDAGRFSFNVEGGRCTACHGVGFTTIDMQFLPDVVVRCAECDGTRYRPEVLEITYRGRNIAEVLDLTARQAFGFFKNRPRVQSRLRPLLDIGLDYLRLGQPASCLSGGETQRLKLAGFLSGSLASLSRTANSPKALFLFDEPSAGLHPTDVVKLLDVLNGLVDRGHSVILIEHSPSFMLAADWVIDLGPGPGAEGGQVVAQGTPEQVAKSKTLTGRVLARLLAKP
jgi:excinuclease ABC subunit A